MSCNVVVTGGSQATMSCNVVEISSAGNRGPGGGHPAGRVASLARGRSWGHAIFKRFQLSRTGHLVEAQQKRAEQCRKVVQKSRLFIQQYDNVVTSPNDNRSKSKHLQLLRKIRGKWYTQIFLKCFMSKVNKPRDFKVPKTCYCWRQFQDFGLFLETIVVVLVCCLAIFLAANHWLATYNRIIPTSLGNPD